MACDGQIFQEVRVPDVRDQYGAIIVEIMIFVSTTSKP